MAGPFDYCRWLLHAYLTHFLLVICEFSISQLEASYVSRDENWRRVMAIAVIPCCKSKKGVHRCLCVIFFLFLFSFSFLMYLAGSSSPSSKALGVSWSLVFRSFTMESFVSTVRFLLLRHFTNPIFQFRAIFLSSEPVV